MKILIFFIINIVFFSCNLQNYKNLRQITRNLNQQQVLCPYFCKTCVNQTQQCDSCPDSQTSFRNDNSGQNCPCQQNYGDNGTQVCQLCDTSCSQGCEINQITGLMGCKQCDESQNRQQLNQNGQCLCKPSYYDRGEQYCCHISCQECNQQGCTSCFTQQSQYFRELTPDPISKQCECLAGYYSQDYYHECKKCKDICKECKSEYECTKCIDSMYLNDQKQCVCKSNFYLVTNAQNISQCEECDIKCRSCSIKDKCKVCVNNTLLPPDCIQKFCVSPQVYNSTMCITCMPQCKTCSNEYSCDTCQDNAVWENFIYEDCIKNFQIYDKSTCSCQKSQVLLERVGLEEIYCPSYCKDCQQTFVCDECLNSLFQLPHCICLKNQYFSIENPRGCVDCPFGCSSCDAEDPYACISDEIDGENQYQQQQDQIIQNNNDIEIEIQEPFIDVPPAWFMGTVLFLFLYICITAGALINYCCCQPKVIDKKIKKKKSQIYPAPQNEINNLKNSEILNTQQQQQNNGSVINESYNTDQSMLMNSHLNMNMNSNSNSNSKNIDLTSSQQLQDKISPKKKQKNISWLDKDIDLSKKQPKKVILPKIQKNQQKKQ